MFAEKRILNAKKRRLTKRIISVTILLKNATKGRKRKMEKKRNGLLELYRLFFCFWVMHHHDFFFFKNNGGFSDALLAVDFFFILSGFFLIRSMRKTQSELPLKGMIKLVWSRLKPITFALCFVGIFNLICIALFIRADLFGVLFEVFRYWWYVLYLSVSIGLFYLLYRWVKNEKVFAIILAGIALSMGVFHYMLEERNVFIYEFTFIARAFGYISIGMLFSYIPKWRTGKVNVSTLITLLLIPTVFCFAYYEKTYWIWLIMMALYALLVYFTSNISFNGKLFDIIGQMSAKMYVYMAFVSMLNVMGLSNHRLLFLIDVALSALDVLLSHYYRKYQQLKKQSLLKSATGASCSA